MQITRHDIDWVAQYSEDAFIWVNVKKLDSLWRLDEGFYIEKSLNSAGPEKYQKFGTWFSKNFEAIVMPHICLFGEKIGFSNGRNRFAWLRDRGLKALPVTTDPKEALVLKKVIGTRSRKSTIIMHY